MKFLSIILLLFALQTAGQKDTTFDTIVLQNGDELKVKVLEVGANEVKYKKSENMNGPSYALERSKIFLIKYANGSKDVFGTAKPSNTNPGNGQTNEPPKKKPEEEEKVRKVYNPWIPWYLQ